MTATPPPGTPHLCAESLCEDLLDASIAKELTEKLLWVYIMELRPTPTLPHFFPKHIIMFPFLRIAQTCI